jgi:ketol-acid reductoisomerase
MGHKLLNTLIIGLGNQAKAWALNLRDSGHDVALYLRPNSKSLSLAKELGFDPISKEEIKIFNSIALLTPDDTHLNVLNELNEYISEDTIILYAHGYSMVQDKLDKKFPRFRHVLFAPKAIASELRYQYETKGKLGAVYSLEKTDESLWDSLSDFSSKLGITSGPYRTSFENETYADLFSEQTLLCTLLPYASNMVFKKLREKGIEKEVAYFEAWYEVKLIADTLIKIGPEAFFELISPNALLGAYLGKERIIDENFEKNIQSLMDDIYSGKFQEVASQSDFENIRNEMKNYWKTQELSHTATEFSEQLF